MLTMKQLSDKLGRSKMAIYNHLHRLFIDNDRLIQHTYINKNHNRVFDETLVTALVKSFNGHKQGKLSTKIKDGKIDALRHQIAILKHKQTSNTVNKIKVDGLLKENKTLKLNLENQKQNYNYQKHQTNKIEKLLDQQQQLQLSTNNENHQLKLKLKHVKKLPPKTHPKHYSIFYRLLHW